MFESKGGIIFIAGVGFFVLAFLSNGLVAMLLYADRPELTAEQMVNDNVLLQFRDLAARYPEQFAAYVGEMKPENERELCATTLKQGRTLYVGEGCWHCHSQFVRPVAREMERWGPVSKSAEYQNELQRPVLFGTRRVGPDLIREGGRRSNDWHAAHFFNPRSLAPDSVMPSYEWFFDRPVDFFAAHPRQDPQKPATAERRKLINAQPQEVRSPLLPNGRGLALILYMQWLGSWQPNYFTQYRDPGVSVSGALP